MMPQSGVRIKVKNIVAKFSKSDQSIAEVCSLSAMQLFYENL